MIRRGRAWFGLTVVLGLGCQGPLDDLGGSDSAGSSDWRAPASTADGRGGVAADGRQTVWLMLRQQADLGAARGMRDWRARGQMVFDRLRGMAGESQGPLREILRSRGIDHQSFWIVNAIRVTADPGLVRLLSQFPEVASVHPDRTLALPPRLEGTEDARTRPSQWGLENIGAPAVWEKFGFRGQGVVVASIDTGVDFEHPALRRQYRGTQPDGTFDHNYSWYDPARVCGNPSPHPCDNAGHGTHTMGIIVGDDENELEPNHIGVAPRARWIAAKGCESGDCSLASLLRAGEWMLAPTDLNGTNPRPDMRPHIVNNSWSAGAGDDVFFRNVVKAWVAAGIFPAFASGNDGPGCSSADSPADYSESYAIGAHDSNNQIASFSSRGNTILGGTKPNISAPGVNIRSSIPGGLYGVSNGTSMATPHVSGTVALLWSAAPGLMGDVAATRSLLDQTAIDTEDLSCGGTAQNNNVFGEGRLDAFAAVNLAPRAPTGKLEGIIRGNLGGHAAALAAGRLRAEGPADRTSAVDANGAFAMVLPAGRYKVTASAFGYRPETIGEVVVVDEERTVSNFILEPAPTHTVRGVIRQTDGRPLAGARVLLEGTPLLAAVTDSSGAYLLPGVPPGAYQLSASRGGCFSRTRHPISVEAGDAEMDLSLPRRTDYYGYFCEPQRAGFIDANQVLPLTGERGTIAVPLPFGFSFYGRIYHHAEIASAGYLSFVPPPRPPGAAVRHIPEAEAPNAAIYAFWDDLIIDEGASVRTELVGTAPQRAFVVEWRDVAFRDAPDLRVRFEIVLHEDGRILTQYLTAGPDRRQRGASATVGLEDADGGDGLEYSSHDASLDSGAALLYALPPSGVLQGQIIDANDGRPLQGVQLLAWNEATGARSTFTDGDGRYRLEMRVGLQALGIYGPSYGEETRAITVAQGDSLRLDVALRSGQPAVAPAALDFPAGDLPWRRFTLTNTGTRELSYDIASADLEVNEAGTPWLSARPGNGVLAPGEQQIIEVFVDAANLPVGQHRGQLLVWTDTPATVLTVPVSLSVAPPPPARAHRLPPAFLDVLRTPNPAQQKRGFHALSAPRIEASAMTSSDGQ
jgi:subtilisin family serine protease